MYIRKRGEFQSHPQLLIVIAATGEKIYFVFFFVFFDITSITPAPNKRGVYKRGAAVCGSNCSDPSCYILLFFRKKKIVWIIYHNVMAAADPLQKKDEKLDKYLYLYYRASRIYIPRRRPMSVICRRPLCLFKGVCCVANCVVSLDIQDGLYTAASHPSHVHDHHLIYLLLCAARLIYFKASRNLFESLDVATVTDNININPPLICLLTHPWRPNPAACHPLLCAYIIAADSYIEWRIRKLLLLAAVYSRDLDYIYIPRTICCSLQPFHHHQLLFAAFTLDEVH